MTAESQPSPQYCGTLEPVGPRAQAISEYLALLACLVATFFALAWMMGGAQLQAWLIHWIRPDVALACAAIAASLFVHVFLASRTYRFALQRAFGLGGLGIGLYHLNNFFYDQPSSVLALINPGISRSYILMAPMAAFVMVLTSVAATLYAYPQSRSCRTTAVKLSLLVCLVAAGFMASAIFHWVSFQRADGARIMLPGASLVILMMNASFLLSTPDATEVRAFIGLHPAARLARQLLLSCIGSLLTLGAVGVSLQHTGLLNLQESTAFLVSLGIAIWFYLLWGHIGFVRSLFDKETSHLTLLEEALGEGRRLYNELEEDRARMRGIFDAAINHSIITTDAHGLIDFFSTGAEKLLGFRADEMVGKRNPLQLHDPFELEARAKQLGVSVSFDIFRAVPNLQQVDQREWTYITKTGERLPVSLTVTALRNSKYEITGYLGIGRDLRVEKTLQSERDAFLAIGQELLCNSDPLTGKFISVSPAFFAIFGYQPEELIGRSFFDFIHPADQDETLKVVSRVLEGLKLRRFENRWRGKDGNYRWITWDASIPLADGLLYASGWDVTEEKLRAEKIEGLLQSEQHLIGIVSHDLRNPISAISMGAQLILRHKDKAERIEKYAQRILDGCLRAERMIYDILDFSKERHGGGISIERAPLDLVELTAKNVEEVQLAHPQAAISFRATGTATISGDGGRISQVIGNLLGNACKYAPAGSPIEVLIERSQSDVVLAVHNGGEPISPDALPHLFKPMQRGSAKGEAQHNVGLGLYIVRQIVAKHGGSIDVESSAEAGTTFRVVLPNEGAPIAG